MGPQAAIRPDSTIATVVASRATSASDALRLFRQTQASSGVTSCAVFQKGVLLSQSELEQAARREENLNAKLG